MKHHIQWMLIYYTSYEGNALENPWIEYHQDILQKNKLISAIARAS